MTPKGANGRRKWRRSPASDDASFPFKAEDNTGSNPVGDAHYGMSGIRDLGTSLLELARRGCRRAIVGVCTAGGMSTAAYLERP